jgi:hypothetical protein
LPGIGAASYRKVAPDAFVQIVGDPATVTIYMHVRASEASEADLDDTDLACHTTTLTSAICPTLSTPGSLCIAAPATCRPKPCKT